MPDRSRIRAGRFAYVQHYRSEAIPTLLLFQYGRIVEVFQGVQSKRVLQAMLEAAAPAATPCRVVRIAAQGQMPRSRVVRATRLMAKT